MKRFPRPVVAAPAGCPSKALGYVSPRGRPVWPDGPRKFREVGDAVVAVLAQTESELRVKAIHAEVERLQRDLEIIRRYFAWRKFDEAHGRLDI